MVRKLPRLLFVVPVIFLGVLIVHMAGQYTDPGMSIVKDVTPVALGVTVLMVVMSVMLKEVQK